MCPYSSNATKVHMSSLKATQTWVYVAVLSAALLAVTVLAALLAKGSNASSAAEALIQTFPGTVAAPSKDAIPAVAISGSWYLDGNSPFPCAITCLHAALHLPKNYGRTLFLTGGLLPVRLLCNTFVPADIKSMPWGISTEGAIVTADTVSIGVGRAKSGNKYKSAFLQELSARGFTGWAFTNRLNVCAVYAGIPYGECSNWGWTPFVTSATAPNLYVIALTPAASEPWTHAVIDVGRWLSVFPGSANNGRSLLLRTSSKISVPVMSATYVSTLKETEAALLQPGWCLLGASAVAYQSGCAFDLDGNRFGLSTLAVGNIVAAVQSYTF
jgi:hypothetical protein